MAGQAHRKASGLDPDIREFVDAIARETARNPALDTLPRPAARLVLERVRAPWAAGGPAMAELVEDEIPGAHGPVRVRVYRPARHVVTPALVYMHGGGWTWFSLDTHDRLMREYAARTGFAVVGVDYALAPEARYPVALNQVLDVIDHLHRADARTYGIDPSRLAAGGDSAGANLALAAALALRDRGAGGRLRALLLNYGAYSQHNSAEAVRSYGGPEHMLPASEMADYWQNYIRDPSDLDDPQVCPLNADLRDLPPALLVVPECDVLAEQSLALAEAMQAAGGHAEARVYAGATHSFLEAMSIAAVSNRALDDSAAWLTDTLA